MAKLDLLQNALLDFYAFNLIEKVEMEKIRDLFEEFDENGDGLLCYKEISEIMKRANKEKQTKKLFKLLDYHHTNDISYEEFIKAFLNKKKLLLKENLKRCFNAIDEDKNGRIDLEEFKKISFLNQDPSKTKEFKNTFYKYSQGKHYVNIIR